jgi:hypothetical protein
MLSFLKTTTVLLFSIALFSFRDNDPPKYFGQFKAITYRKIPFVPSDTNHDGNYQAGLRKIPGLLGCSIKLMLDQDPKNERIDVSIYRNKKRVAHFKPLSFNGSMAPVGDLKYADIDGNGFFDLKFCIWSGGCGLAGEATTKVYIMNKNDSVFTCFSFSDFSDDAEHDIDGDGNYEILSSDYTQHKGHAYFVHNSYNFRNDSLINNSEKFNYPLWTRFLSESRNKVSTVIPSSLVAKSRTEHPNDFYISSKP